MPGMSLKEKIDLERLPDHIAVIMDGNGRWAKQKGKPRVFGHEKGAGSVRRCIEASARLGIRYLTLYAFSTENWNRPKIEVEALMHLLIKSLHKEVDALHENNIRLIAIGDLDALPRKAATELQKAMDKTAQNTGLTVILALSYSARWEITHAMKKIAQLVKNNEIDPQQITSETVACHLCTANTPDPELLIRTSGEMRISNFLLWQIAYAELYFSEVLWPDFTEEHLYEAILCFQNRERRFGKTSEQLHAADGSHNL
jgi:undecaprenyl diphosphate synthase